MNYGGVPYQPYQNRNAYFKEIPYNYPANTMSPQSMSSSYEQYYYGSPFEYYEKPEQPSDWQTPGQLYSQPDYSTQQMNQMPTQMPAQMQNAAQSNQPESAPFDFNKMLSTVGLLADTAQQVTPFIKQIGAMINTFR